MIPQFFLIAIATFVSEDLACIAAGVLAAHGMMSFGEAVLACSTGIFAGDLALFFAGRFAGRTLLRSQLAARFLPPERMEQATLWIQERGLAVVFLSRFTPGLRLPTYVAAGALARQTGSFLLYFAIAAGVWTPLLVGATVLLGERFLRGVFMPGSPLLSPLLAGVVAAAVWLLAVRPLMRFETRRRFVGFVLRKVRWEFWPGWAAYLPLLPYFAYLAWKHRSLTLFTLANPGIPTGGFAGESKSDILTHLSSVAGAVPEFTVIRSRLCLGARVRAAQSFLQSNQLGFPVVMKPDRGERGSGVSVIRSLEEVTSYLRTAREDTILQRYAHGLEFGVFYQRHPGEAEGRVTSITEKRFPMVTGDGRSSLRELILKNPRAVCMASAYERVAKRPLDSVPAPGEMVQLVEIGSHCRGTVFLNAGGLRTPALDAAVDRISKAHPGFHLGRFDLRVPSIEALREGRELQVIELNGVSAEPTHIYDPSVSAIEAYSVLFAQWRSAFEIGAWMRERGAREVGLAEMVGILRNRKKAPASLRSIEPSPADGGSL